MNTQDKKISAENEKVMSAISIESDGADAEEESTEQVTNG